MMCYRLEFCYNYIIRQQVIQYWLEILLHYCVVSVCDTLLVSDTLSVGFYVISCGIAQYRCPQSVLRSQKDHMFCAVQSEGRIHT